MTNISDLVVGIFGVIGFSLLTIYLVKGRGENMAIKDYWVYQRRLVQEPWAIYFIKEFDKRNYNQTVCLDYTFYHENVPNATHSISFVGLHYDTIQGYVDEIVSTINDYTSVDNADLEQLKRAVEDILLS